MSGKIRIQRKCDFMYNIHYDVCAIFVLLAELVMFYTRKNMKAGHNKIYIWMIYALLISTVCDLASGIMGNSGKAYSLVTALIANNVYFITHVALPMLFAIYNIAATVKIQKNKTWMKVVFFVPYALVLVLLFVNAFTGFIFRIDDRGQYSRNNGIFVLYAVSILYFLFTIGYVIKNRKYIEEYRMFCVFMFIAFISIPLALQTIFPYFLVEGFGEALCFLLIYASLEQRSELYDSVHGMYNKKAFVNFININTKAEESFSVMSITLDDIEYLEKNFGIECMTALESSVAHYLKQISSGFKVYHMSDYVFYVIDDGVTLHDKSLEDIAAELCGTCEKNWTVGYVEVPVSVDICIMRCPEDVSSLEQIFECTEYVSNEEHERRSRIIHAAEVNSFYGKRKSKVKKAIHKAIKNQSFKVYYQPIYSTKENRINSAEALVRLIDDELGFISPEEFIPIAEEDGSILNIGAFVLESVCRLIKENEIKSKGIEYIEVNVSIIECMKHNMASRVSNMINQYGLEPGQINLEITETAAMNSPGVVGANMVNLVNYGVNFSLDDYGSGYSNINYLVELPFNLIKVDKSIVWSSFENERAGIALESSISMIRKLNYKIVAEGVETKEQAEKLTAMGCEYLQGYYFSKPLPEHEFLMYIAG